MTTFEIIKNLAKKRNMNMKEAAVAIGFSENAFYKWKTSSPSVENLEKVANYFDVSTDYLLGRAPEEEYNKEISIDEALNSVMSYDGKEITDNDRAVLKSIIEGYLKTK